MRGRAVPDAGAQHAGDGPAAERAVDVDGPAGDDLGAGCDGADDGDVTCGVREALAGAERAVQHEAAGLGGGGLRSRWRRRRGRRWPGRARHRPDHEAAARRREPRPTPAHCAHPAITGGSRSAYGPVACGMEPSMPMTRMPRLVRDCTSAGRSAAWGSTRLTSSSTGRPSNTLGERAICASRSARNVLERRLGREDDGHERLAAEAEEGRLGRGRSGGRVHPEGVAGGGVGRQQAVRLAHNRTCFRSRDVGIVSPYGGPDGRQRQLDLPRPPIPHVVRQRHQAARGGRPPQPARPHPKRRAHPRRRPARHEAPPHRRPARDRRIANASNGC